MSVEIFSLIPIKFNNYHCTEIERVKKINLLGDSITERGRVYDTDELKRIDEIFEELNEEEFGFAKNFQPYYIHYVDLEIIKKISIDLFFIEKKKNPYITVKVFKKKYFDYVKFCFTELLNKSKYTNLIESVGNTYYKQSYTLDMRLFYILDDFFYEIEVLECYADAFLKFIEEFDIVEEEENKYITQKTETIEPQPDEVESPNKKALTSCSVQISMLNQMGVLDLPIFQNKSQAQKERILSKLLNRSIRDIRGNLNSLNPNSNEDLTKYTAGSEGTQAKARDILNQL